MNTVRRDEAMRKEEDDIVAHFSVAQAKECHQYHKTIPGKCTSKLLFILIFVFLLAGYKPTPLRNLSSLAKKLQIQNIWVKDESKRFNLNAFKFLGASFSFAKYILGDNTKSLSFEDVLAKVNKVVNDLLIIQTIFWMT